MSLFVDIRKNFGGFTLNVKLETENGVSGLLGASGSGKSMTLMCIAGIVRPDSGKIVLNGMTFFDSEKNINVSPQKRRVGYMFQHYALFPHMTVRQNILCGLSREKDKKIKEQVLYDVLEFMRIKELDGRIPGQLSGGQRQRVALARILAGKPDLLMLDEPFSALDSYLRGQLRAQMKPLLKNFGKDVLFVTHDQEEAGGLCDYTAIFDNGRILAHNKTKALFNDPGSIHAALLTGCENVVSAKMANEYEAYIPDWGITLKTALLLKDGLRAVGIRSRGFYPDAGQNRFAVRLIENADANAEFIAKFRYENQADGTPDILWRANKQSINKKIFTEIGVEPDDVMPLYT